MPPTQREPPVGTLQAFGHWHALQQAELGDRRRMVEREPVSDVRAAVVTDDAEPVMTQRGHEPNHVTRHRPLRVGGMVRQFRRMRRVTVTAKIRTDNRMTFDQARRYRMPGDMRTRMPVQ